MLLIILRQGILVYLEDDLEEADESPIKQYIIINSYSEVYVKTQTRECISRSPLHGASCSGSSTDEALCDHGTYIVMIPTITEPKSTTSWRG